MKQKQYALIYIDPENPKNMNDGDSELIAVGTLSEIAKELVGDRNYVEDNEDNRMPDFLIFDLSTGKKINLKFL